MTQDHRRLDTQMAQEILLDDPDFLREVVERVIQELLEAQMTEHVGVAPYERSATRTGRRNGYKPRTLRTRVGTLDLFVPQDREGTPSTRLFSRYQRNEKHPGGEDLSQRAIVCAWLRRWRWSNRRSGSPDGATWTWQSSKEVAPNRSEKQRE